MKRNSKSVASLKKKLTKVFNEYIRLRDAKLQNGLCISCGKSGNQAGHYFPTSLCPQPSMVFNEKNVNLQCAHCNCWLHGNQHDYAKALNKKYGYDVVGELEIVRATNSKPWCSFEYQVLIKVYEEKIKTMKK